MPAPLTATEPAQLQAFLFASHPEVKKIKVKQWLKFGSVLVNGKVIKRYDHPLQKGDSVEVRTKGETRALKALPRGMKVVYEDEDIIVIDKPEGLLSIASHAETEETAYVALTSYVRQGNKEDRQRVFIVHRLDRETSGLMIFARSEEAKEIMQENWRDAEKHYLAVVEGCPADDEGTMHSHLDERNPFMVFATEPNENTREAITHYEVIERGSPFSLLRLRLETGRRHQIRVQLRDIRCPIVGDEKYGRGEGPVDRMCLHATYLRIRHPMTQQMLAFESPIPDAMKKLVGK